MREFGSEFEIDHLPDGYFSGLARKMAYSAFTRSGREAIGLALEGIPAGTALLPAYSCWSMSLPFEAAGWRVEYYPLKPDITVDIPKLQELINELSPKAVLVMDYFGFAPTCDAVKAVRNADTGILLIEDFTQCLFSIGDKWNDEVDCYVASIRKSIGVPDGGVILSKKPLKTEALSEAQTEFVSCHIEAGRTKNLYMYSADIADKEAFRAAQAKAGEEIKADYKLYKISSTALGILNNTDAETVRSARRLNYEHLYQLIKDNKYIDVMFQPAGNSAPFMMIVKSHQRDLLQAELAKKGLYCQLLWPLSEKARTVCPVAREMEETMLAIPIDQRYDYYDIEEMGRRINEVVL